MNGTTGTMNDPLVASMSSSADQQPDLNLYFSHDLSSSVVAPPSENCSPAYHSNGFYQNYSSPNNCMYQHQNYLAAEHQQQSGTWSSHAFHHRTGNSTASTPNAMTLLQRNYEHGSVNNNFALLHQQPISPEERSNSAQSYASSPISCASVNSPVASPLINVGCVTQHCAVYNGGSNSSSTNSPAGHHVLQQAGSYQELFSPVSPYCCDS